MENRELSILFTEKTAGTDGRRITAAVSSEAIDRDDEIVSAAAMKAAMTAYMRNPVILAAHTHKLADGTSPVVGRVCKWWQEANKTFCEIEFADTPLGLQYWTLYSGKYQKAFSIGFRSHRGESRNIDGKSVYVHTDIELFEISAVAVPANPEALSKHAKGRIAFIQGMKQHVRIDELMTDSKLVVSAIEKQESIEDGDSRTLSQDEMLVLDHLKKQGIPFAEALFSFPDYPEFAEGATDAMFLGLDEDVDDEKFFDPDGTGTVCEPNYAAIFKK
jgi:HK97 family phage prohead protease